MKELTNEEISKLAGMIRSDHTATELARLVGGDLSHIGRGILEGRRVNFLGCHYQKADCWNYRADSESFCYSLEPIKEYHHGTEPIEGLKNFRKWVIQDNRIIMEFDTKKQADKFASGLVKKAVE